MMLIQTLQLTCHSHYFPALYFSIIALCQIYDFIFSRFNVLGLPQRPFIGRTAAILFIGVAIFAFTLLAPLAYGNQWTQSECNRVKLLKTWDWDCSTFHTTYDQYSFDVPSVESTIPASSPVPVPPPADDANVTPGVNAPLPSGGIVHREEKIEYRDEHGNLLNEEQVKELSGKVSFETRYETRTRIIDALGHELYEGPAGSVPEHLKQRVAPVPNHPDVEGGNPETKGAPKEGDASDAPPSVDAERDLELDRERSAKGESGKPRPASEKGNEATKKEL